MKRWLVVGLFSLSVVKMKARTRYNDSMGLTWYGAVGKPSLTMGALGWMDSNWVLPLVLFCGSVLCWIYGWTSLVIVMCDVL